MRTVTIIQRRLTHYRVPLFERLREELGRNDIRLRLLHGDPTPAEASKSDSGHLPWAEHLATRYYLQGRILWQPFMAQVAQADLVIVTQENKHLHNLPPLLNPARRQRLAFWGHGRNMQARAGNAWRERFKQWMVNRVDWWFAYTDISRDQVMAAGFPVERITVLNNSVDTSALRAQVETASREGRAGLRTALGLGSGPVACFIGSLYADKRLDFLIATADRLHAMIPGFELVIAGEGPDRVRVESARASRKYLHYLGSAFGERKAKLLAASDVMMNPGLVGLGILDSFVAGIPMLTTDCRIHSPEIAYLENEVNGLITANDVQSYATAGAALLSNDAALNRLRAGALESSQRYSVQAMARQFSSGIQDALNSA